MFSPFNVQAATGFDTPVCTQDNTSGYGCGDTTKPFTTTTQKH